MTTADAEYSKVKTSVWWDIENCEVPKGWDAHAIAQNVSSALLNMNYGGPVSISAYGDTNLIPHAVQQALSSTGVGLNHVPAGVKDASDKKILVDMLLWAVDNPAPANFMLISGDRDFSNALHQLSMRRYTILLAQPPRASAPLVAAAKNVWLWTSLASGGPPLTSGESSRLVNNGRCRVSNNEASKDPVSEQAPSSKPTDSTCDDRESKNYKTRENHVPRGLPQETRRNILQNGRKATGDSVASCGSFEAHLSDRRHTSQAALVASHKAQANVSAKPIQEAAFVASHKAQANVSAKPIQEAALVASHKSQANVSAKPIQEAAFVASHKAQANVSAKPIQEAAFVASHKAQANVSAKPMQEAALVEPVLCIVCQIYCTSKDALANHTYGKRHRNNWELQFGKSENMLRGKFGNPKEAMEKQKNKRKKASEGRIKPNGDYPCRLCNVVCQSQVVFDSHLRGQKHAAMLSQSEALTDSKKLQEKGVGEKDKPREAIAEPKPNGDYSCRLCNVVCQSQIVFDSHLRGQKHASMLSQSEELIGSKKLQEKGAGEKDRPRETIAEPKPNADHVCRLCNVTCQSQVVFDSHLRGQKHAAMLSQSKALIDSKKLQEKGVGKKDQPREANVEPQLQSQNAQEDSKCLEQHVAMLNPSEAPVNSMKLEEKFVQEKVQSIETIAELQSQSQNTRDNTKLFEKPNEEFREICGTTKNSVKEKTPSTKNWVETAFFGDLRCDFGTAEVARECFDGIVMPINLSEGATEKENEVMIPRAIAESNKICDSQGLSTGVCDINGHWTKEKDATAAFEASDSAQSSIITKPIMKEPEVLQPVWCQVCQITCNSKVAYANHTYGKKHRQKLELESAKNEIMSKGQAKLSRENADKMKKESCKNQIPFDPHLKSQNHAAMVNEQTEAHVASRRTRQESDQKELQHALIVDSMKIQEEIDQEKVTRGENTLTKTDNHVFKGVEEDKEEVKEVDAISESVINAISENLARAFTELNRDSRIPKESRGCLDVIPERVQLREDVNVTKKLEDVNVTEKLEDESKHKLLPKSRGPEKESARRKELLGEAAKREENKDKVDNFWTRLWGKKS